MRHSRPLYHTLTFADLTNAYRLEVGALNDLAAGPVEALKVLRSPSRLDDAGIPVRSRLVYQDVLDSKFTREQLGAAYVWLRNRNCCQQVIDALEAAIPA